MEELLQLKILLLNLAGDCYAVRQEDILFHDKPNIHWLKDSDGAVTAIAMIKANPVILADLSCCLGLTPIPRGGQYPVMIPAGHDSTVCFVVRREAEEVQIPSAAAFHLPAYLRTPFIDTCVEIDGQLIPLINIQAILRCISEVGYTPPAPLPRLLSSPKKELSSCKAFRIFSCNKKTFSAMSDYFSSEQAQPAGVLTALPLLPEFVCGITLHRNQVLTVLDLRRYLQPSAEKQGGGGKWLIGSVAGQNFAFVVDADQGILPADTVTLAPLPLLVQSDWRRNALLHARKIIPVLDFEGLLAQPPDATGAPATAPTLRSEEHFESVFGRQQIEIIEISLFGVIYALPAVEVADTLPLTHYQRLTGTGGLVAGVTLYKNELLPVLDLEGCFGRKSHPGPAWKLLLICNGDLRALVLAEELIGKRSLSLREQRMLPFTIPHSSVYGCYLISADRVGLILNIFALAVYCNAQEEDELSCFSEELFFFSDDIPSGKKNIGGFREQVNAAKEEQENRLGPKIKEMKNSVLSEHSKEADRTAAGAGVIPASYGKEKKAMTFWENFESSEEFSELKEFARQVAETQQKVSLPPQGAEFLEQAEFPPLIPARSQKKNRIR